MTIVKVTNPVKIPSIDTLMACRNGLTKRIKNANNSDKYRLKLIRSEIDFLIETL